MRLGLKVDVDTDRGTRIGVKNLLALFKKLDLRATFLFSLGPDHTGRALKRIFRPGFFKKVSRTSILQNYGLRTLLNGVLLPGPNIGKLRAGDMLCVRDDGHEVGIHCYDHVKWQDNLSKMSQRQVIDEFEKARKAFYHIFEEQAITAGAAGWQANAFSLQAYDQAALAYASDTRGHGPFYPVIDGVPYKTLQLPTTIPTLDELLGRENYPLEEISNFYRHSLKSDGLNIFTLHAELEGMAYIEWFEDFLKTLLRDGIDIGPLNIIANHIKDLSAIPYCELIQGQVEGRSGTLACQGNNQILQEIKLPL